jgi:hypothetical protein
MMHSDDLVSAIRYRTRRHFFRSGAQGLGLAALSSLLRAETETGGLKGLPHFPPTAKSVIYIHLVGGPPQHELFDYKPQLKDWYDKDLPESIRQGQRLTSMTSGQSRFPIAPSVYGFQQHGQSGAWISELLPNTAKLADSMAIIRTMHTEAINHEPAITFMQTGNQLPGKPCMGSWISYGLGSMNQNLPAFVVLHAAHTHPKANVQAISARLWSSGFLPSTYSGVALRSSGDPVLYLSNPDGVSAAARRIVLDGLHDMNEKENRRTGDPEVLSRIEQYEMAFRMQSSVPELADIGHEPETTYKLYGEEARTPGSFARTCVQARRLVERGVRFVQVYQRGWDLHGDLPEILPSLCKDVDQACYGLVEDLRSRGLLDETLVLWGGEFGRTVYSQGKLTPTDYGRDHHPKCFSVWMAGGGVRPGITYGETDDFSYNIAKDPVHVRDLQATILHTLGIDHERLTYAYQGLDQKLTGVEKARVVKPLLV